MTSQQTTIPATTQLRSLHPRSSKERTHAEDDPNQYSAQKRKWNSIRATAELAAEEAESVRGPLQPFSPALKSKLNASEIYDEYKRFIDYCTDPRAPKMVSPPVSKQMSERRKVLNEVRHLSQSKGITLREALHFFDDVCVTNPEVRSTNTLVKYCAGLKLARGSDRHTTHRTIMGLFDLDLDKVVTGLKRAELQDGEFDEEDDLEDEGGDDDINVARGRDGNVGEEQEEDEEDELFEEAESEVVSAPRADQAASSSSRYSIRRR